MQTTHVQFLRAVALRTPYAFGDTGLTPSVGGRLALAQEEFKTLTTTAKVLMLGAFAVGTGITYLFMRK